MLLKVIFKLDKLNYLEERQLIKDISVMDKIIMFQLYKEAEKNKLCKLWETVTIELYYVRIDG
jgi:hypothetical protein